MNLGPHAFFIVTAYAVTGIIIAILIGWIVAEHRALTRTLADFDARGITRRSTEPKSAAQKSAA